MRNPVIVMLALLSCVLLVTVDALPGRLPSSRGRSYYDDDSAPANSYQRLPISLQRRDWCARWGDYCVPETRVRFATCCDGLRCVCGSLWMAGKCQCKTPSVFGR